MMLKQKTPLFRSISALILASFLHMQAAWAQAQLPMPVPGTRLELSEKFTPALMVGLELDRQNPFKFSFLINPGQEKLDEPASRAEYQKIIKYFLASLTTPNKDMWVNLSPYEGTRIIADNFSKTEMGRDLLSQDYLLKQMASSLLYPGTALGKNFWDKVYKKAYEKFATTDVAVDTFNKVWITPDKAVVFEKQNGALVLESHLKVMLESDYLAQSAKGDAPVTSSLTRDIFREVVIPLLEQEVNEGEHFAPLRQIYSAMIVATWFKQSLKKSILGQVYADQSKVAGVNLDSPQEEKERIYNQYLEAYKIGVFNFIKEDADPATQEPMPRKYFSGGVVAPESVSVVRAVPDASQSAWLERAAKGLLSVTVLLSGVVAPSYSAAQAPSVQQGDEGLETHIGSLWEQDGPHTIVRLNQFIQEVSLDQNTVKAWIEVIRKMPSEMNWQVQFIRRSGNIFQLSVRPMPMSHGMTTRSQGNATRMRVVGTVNELMAMAQKKRSPQLEGLIRDQLPLLKMFETLFYELDVIEMPGSQFAVENFRSVSYEPPSLPANAGLVRLGRASMPPNTLARDPWAEAKKNGRAMIVTQNDAVAMIQRHQKENAWVDPNATEAWVQKVKSMPGIMLWQLQFKTVENGRYQLNVKPADMSFGPVQTLPNNNKFKVVIGTRERLLKMTGDISPLFRADLEKAFGAAPRAWYFQFDFITLPNGQVSFGNVQPLEYTLPLVPIPQAPRQDKAQTPLGGIDLDETLMNMQIRRDSQGSVLSAEDQPKDVIEKLMAASGFRAVILDISPVNPSTLF
ncbi:MAG: hypothetical protein HQL16_06550 [Candidatus Omnitrophica bacterium]|nr:hypothetical protein [Candidatus Omnitrophota bacterium]